MPMHDLVTDHYRRLLAHRYEWMLGGAELQLQQAERLIEQLDLRPRAGGRVAELGGGPGFFAVALARGGFTVDLVDTSEFLLERARAHAQQLPVHTHAEDLVASDWPAPAPPPAARATRAAAPGRRTRAGGWRRPRAGRGR